MKAFSCLVIAAVVALPAAAQWSPAKAASYLDNRIEWWITWQNSQRDRGTFCVSCHTAAPYGLGRSALRSALGEQTASHDEHMLLDNIAQRVRMWKEIEPLYPDAQRGAGKTAESRGTESVINALVLAWNDRPAALSSDTKLAFDNMWAEQLTSGDAKGAWAWLQFHNSPWEGDSQYYGAALAAIAVGYAPGDYKSSPEIQDRIRALGQYLRHELPAQKTIDKLVVLWASSGLPDLLTEAQRRDIIAETVSKQQPDGGFSLSTLVGDWKRHDNTPLEARSDGYATALAAFAFRQAGMKQGDAVLERSLQWLSTHQQSSDGRWLAYSLNKQRDLNSDAGKFMSDAATAYAVMALEAR